MNKTTLAMLKELTEAHGVSGFEEEIQSVIKKHLPSGTKIEYDRLGSIVCKKEGVKGGPRIMIPGHMDEIGFMVKFITDQGFIKFSQLGGWPDQVLLSQRVVIRGSKGDVPGLIGSKPPHFLTAEEQAKVVKKEDMFIDVGAKDKKEATEQMGIRVGDPIAPESPFGTLKNWQLLVAKAWDDRVGCALFIEVLKALQGRRHPNAVYGVGTVQEEVGTRGGQTCANVVEPDICLVAESGIAMDVPGIKPEESQGKLGGGPMIYVLDGGMIAHRRLREFVVGVAEKKKIPHQFGLLERGATDGRPVHLHARGVPSIFIGVPVRYIHCHAGIIDAGDFDHTVSLMVETVMRLDAKAVRSIGGE